MDDQRAVWRKFLRRDGLAFNSCLTLRAGANRLEKALVAALHLFALDRAGGCTSSCPRL
jgi:hypothetical protein